MKKSVIKRKKALLILAPCVLAIFILVLAAFVDSAYLQGRIGGKIREKIRDKFSLEQEYSIEQKQKYNLDLPFPIDIEGATKPGYLIIHANEIPENTFDDYIAVKSNEYDIKIASIDDINLWCYPNYPDITEVNPDCDTTEVPVWGGNEPFIVDGGQLIPVASDIEEFCGDCIDSWPSVVRSYLYDRNRNEFDGNLEYLLIVSDAERFPYVVIWDQILTFLYYADLSEDPINNGTLHTWNRHEDEKLAQLFYLDEENPTFKDELRKKFADQIAEMMGDDTEQKILNYVKCNSFDNECDDVDLEPYLPEVAIGILPFEDPQFIRDFLADSVSVEINTPEMLKNALFAAVTVFINHDNWIPTESASNIWSRNRDYQSVEIYGEGKETGESGIQPYPRPNCGYFPEDRERCWFDNSRETGFGYTLFNSHGSPTQLVGILSAGEVNSNVLSDTHSNIYASIACSNLALRDLSTGYATLTVEILDLGDDKHAVLFSDYGSIHWDLWYIYSYKFGSDGVVTPMSVSIPNKPSVIYRGPMDEFAGDDFIVGNEKSYTFISTKNDGFTVVDTVPNKTEVKRFASSELADINYDGYPEVVAAEDGGKFVVYTYDTNLLLDDEPNRHEYDIPTQIVGYVHEVNLTADESGEKQIFIGSYTQGMDPFTIVIINEDGTLDSVSEVDHPFDIGHHYEQFDSLINEDFDQAANGRPDILLQGSEGYFVAFTSDEGILGEWAATPIHGANPFVVDYNDDGFLDIMTVSESGLNVFVWDGDNWAELLLINTPASVEPKVINRADLNGDGIQDLIVGGVNVDDNLSSGIIYAYGQSEGGFSEWYMQFPYQDLPYVLFDNIAYRLLRYGDGRAYVGAVVPTISTMRGAWLSETEFTRELSEGKTVGRAIKNVIERYMDRCTRERLDCGFWNYKEQLWDFFIFLQYGDPTARIPN